MEIITEYIQPELIVVSFVLYFIGLAIKQIQIPNKYIPLILGFIGIALCVIYIVATTDMSTTQLRLYGVFTAIVQGVLVAGLSTYVDQMIKQLRKDE